MSVSPEAEFRYSVHARDKTFNALIPLEAALLSEFFPMTVSPDDSALSCGRECLPKETSDSPLFCMDVPNTNDTLFRLLQDLLHATAADVHPFHQFSNVPPALQTDADPQLATDTCPPSHRSGVHGEPLRDGALIMEPCVRAALNTSLRQYPSFAFASLEARLADILARLRCGPTRHPPRRSLMHTCRVDGLHCALSRGRP